MVEGRVKSHKTLIVNQGRRVGMGVFYKDQSRVACRESHYQTSAVVQG